MPNPPETGPVIERAYLDMKPGGGANYIALWPEFREILMSLPGAVSCELLRSHAKAESFVCCMQWESKAAKDIFIADPRLKPWAQRFWPNVDHEVVEYYESVG
ncbi:antibiotic biosynthesis monooxygenase [Sphingobium sp. Sx8-8]|uniref:antibiotic biosynthesis monooxygenase family protein n=1 Tax=Sphingobium sp. Sx8-8 TaxID=2933617 RepID=UPI001F59FF52|nr:antibiotic biosynthesis monooxygenase [Sphingobium sp. Sx8-8]